MTTLRRFVNRITISQWIFLGAGLLLGAGAGILGVSDNPPGIIMLYLSLACLAAAWVWNWRSPREYWILLFISLLAFPVGVVMHNLLYALETMVTDIKILSGLLNFLAMVFFLVSVMAAGPSAIVALVGGIFTSWRGMGRLTKINRSFRRFVQTHEIKDKHLYKLLHLVKQSASGANLQPLKFILSNTEEKNDQVFNTLSWAGYLKDWDGPEEGERPTAYIVLLGDTDIAKSFQYDAGIASQSITLGAVEMGLGACLIGSIKRDALRSTLVIPEKYEILLVIALGKPDEKVTLAEVGEEGDVKYWRDEKDVHYVPKRGLEEVILDL